MINIKVKKLTPTAKLPTYGSCSAACADLYADIPDVTFKVADSTEACEGLCIPPHSTIKIPTGLSFQPPKGYYAQIFARSGLATKQGLRPANCVGICDEDYRGEYIVALHNDTEMDQVIHHGDRIAQVLFERYEQASFEEVTELDVTERGAGGFGSTGTN